MEIWALVLNDRQHICNCKHDAVDRLRFGWPDVIENQHILLDFDKMIMSKLKKLQLS